MTPDDVAAIRAQAKAGYAIGPFHVMALIDALTAAWAERDAHIDAGWEAIRAWETTAQVWRERAERAEAEVAYLQSEEAADAMLRDSRERAERAEAALARVRALCDHAFNEQGYDFSCFEHDIRAAIEGPTP